MRENEFFPFWDLCWEGEGEGEGEGEKKERGVLSLLCIMCW